jgi:HSP20 family protein
MSISLFNDPFFGSSDPWRSMKRVQREMNRMFGDLEDASSSNGTVSSKQDKDQSISLWRPKVDIKETEKDFLIHADLPGIKKEDIHMEVKDGVLSISGERKQEKKTDTDKFHRVERSYGKFTRSFAVPSGVSEEQIAAKFDNGVLEVSIPKPVKKVPETKKITIN